jgi:hypothetical protein
MDGDSNRATGDAKRPLNKELLLRRRSSQPTDQLALEEVRKLLGPSYALEGEDQKGYEELLRRVGYAVQSYDIIDWLLVKDVVDLTTQVHRLRHHRERILQLARGKAMANILDELEILEEEEEESIQESIWERRDRMKRLALEWLSGNDEATKYVLGLLEGAGLSARDVIEQATLDQATELDRIDDRIGSYERRRDSLLQQIERRHAGVGRLVSRATEEVIEAEFQELAPDTDQKTDAPKLA